MNDILPFESLKALLLLSRFSLSSLSVDVSSPSYWNPSPRRHRHPSACTRLLLLILSFSPSYLSSRLPPFLRSVFSLPCRSFHYTRTQHYLRWGEVCDITLNSRSPITSFLHCLFFSPHSCEWASAFRFTGIKHASNSWAVCDYLGRFVLA